MRLLDRYLLRELLVPLAYCLGGFLVFYIAFDLIFEINRFQDAHLHFLMWSSITLSRCRKSWPTRSFPSRSCWPPLRADQSQPAQRIDRHARGGHQSLAVVRCPIWAWELFAVLPFLPSTICGCRGPRTNPRTSWNAAKLPARTAIGPAAGIPQRSRPAPLEHGAFQPGHFRNDYAPPSPGIRPTARAT